MRREQNPFKQMGTGLHLLCAHTGRQACDAGDEDAEHANGSGQTCRSAGG